MKNIFSFPIAILLCVVFFVLAIFGVYNDTLTSDEVSHIPDGYYYLNTGRYFINPEHPPIIKDVAAVPLMFMGLEIPDYPLDREYHNPQWDYGRDFLFNVGNDPDQIVFWSRLAIILFNTILLFLLFVFLKRLFNATGSLIAIFFLALSPTFLAHGSLVTTDTILAYFLMLALVTFALFLKHFLVKKIYWLYFALSVLFTAGALLTKFSAFMLVIIMFLGGLLYLVLAKKIKKCWLKYILLFALLCVMQIAIIGAYYAPHVVNMDDTGLTHQIDSNYPDSFPQIGKNYMEWSIDNGPFFTGITEYAVGVLMVRGRVASAWQTIYFLGDVYGSEGAGVGYFPVLFFTKITLGFFFLFLLSIILGIKNITQQIKERFKNIEIRPFEILLWSLVVVYLLVSFTSRLQIGLRHILPVMTAIYLLVGGSLGRWFDKKNYKYVIALLMIIMLGGSLIAFPHYLPFYNSFVGGTSNGYKIATDSNYDWMNQDIKRLASYLEQNDIEYFYGDLDVNFPHEYYLGDKLIPFNIKEKELPTSGEYLIVSVEAMQRNDFQGNPTEEQKYSNLMEYEIARVGMTIFVFQMP